MPMARTPIPRRYYTVTWEELQDEGRELARRLRRQGTWKRIIAITRGGLVPAAIISRELGIRNVDTVCISSYRGEHKGRHRIIKSVSDADDGAGVLIIDDLVDTGKTARHLRKMLPEAHLAVVFAKPAGVHDVDTYVKEVSQETWIVFPWASGGTSSDRARQSPTSLHS